MNIVEFLREAKCCIRCLHRLSGKHNRTNFALGRASHDEVCRQLQVSNNKIILIISVHFNFKCTKLC